MEAILETRSGTGWAIDRLAVPDDAEASLVRGAMRGERGAFGRLYQRHAVGIFAYVRFRVQDSQLAEDLTQDIFVNAYTHLDQLRDADRFRVWLLTIARNRLANHWRANAARPRLMDLPTDDDAGDSPDPALTESPVEALDEALQHDAIRRAMTNLTALQREVLECRFIAGLSVAETAGFMGRSEGAVKNLQFHALAALRRLDHRNGVHP